MLHINQITQKINIEGGEGKSTYKNAKTEW